jgi:hypothetical protein
VVAAAPGANYGLPQIEKSIMADGVERCQGGSVSHPLMTEAGKAVGHKDAACFLGRSVPKA